MKKLFFSLSWGSVSISSVGSEILEAHLDRKLGFKIMKFFARFRKKFPTLSSDQFSFVGRSFAMFEDLGITVQNIAMWFPDNLSWFREFLMTCENFLIQSSVTWFRRVWWCILDIMSFNILSPWPIPVWIWIEASITESKFPTFQQRKSNFSLLIFSHF